jgi:hypothetical protein
MTGFLWSEMAETEDEARLKLTGLVMLARAEFPDHVVLERVEFCYLRNCWLCAAIAIPEVDSDLQV